MSGGSYDYLWRAFDMGDISGKEYHLKAMGERLAGLGAADAARETYEALLIIRAAEAQTEAIIGRLRDVWKAVEWVDSCDWGPETIDAALAKYRGTSDVDSGREPC